MKIKDKNEKYFKRPSSLLEWGKAFKVLHKEVSH